MTQPKNPIAEIREAAVEIERNARLATNAWQSLDANQKGRILMELRHDAEDLLKSVAALEAAEGGN